MSRAPRGRLPTRSICRRSSEGRATRDFSNASSNGLPATGSTRSWPTCRLGGYRCVGVQAALGHRGPGEPLQDILSRIFAKPAGECRIAEDLIQSLMQRIDVTWRDENTGLAIPHDFWHAADAARYDGR